MILALEEFANILPFPRADEVAATGSGLGVQLLTVLQDLSQMKDRLGTRAASAVNNHRTKIAVGGISDLDTTEYFSRLAGTAEFVQRSTSSGKDHAAVSTTEGETFRELAPPHLLRELDFGTGVLADGNRPLSRIGLRPYSIPTHCASQTAHRPH